MIELLKELNKQFRTITPESFLIKNHKNQKEIIYPYLTYNLDIENLEHGIDGFYIDVDIFDSNESYVELLTLEKAVKDNFSKKDVLLEDLFIRFSSVRANTIDTLDELVKRRNLQLYCKVYWRDK